MKRCPQCEFIYEDDQNSCDMDGSQLTLDPRPLPKLQALNETSSGSSARRNWKGHTVPLFASISLLITLLFVYYFSVHRAQINKRPPIPVSTQNIPPITVQSVSHEPATADAEPAESPEQIEVAAPETSRGESKERSAKGVEKKQKHEEARPANGSQSKPVTNSNGGKRRPVAEEKKDSKVESALKKTGQFLKRPFKF